MQVNQRWLYIGLVLCVLALSGAGASASSPAATPVPAIGPEITPAQDMPKKEEPKAATFTGTIVKDGDEYVLRDSSGTVYHLDDSSRAKQFEGKSVTVTGQLDADSKTIHVSNIQGAMV